MLCTDGSAGFLPEMSAIDEALVKSEQKQPERITSGSESKKSELFYIARDFIDCNGQRVF